MARSGRLGIAGEVSVGPDREAHKKSAGVTKPVFCNPVFSNPVFARIRTGVFLIGKTIIGRFSNKKLLEQRPMILFRIRSCARPGFVRARRGRGIFFYTEIADLWRLGFIYTEFADAWRLDFIYTEIADTLVVEGLARRRHCFCFIPDASKISSSFSCRFFLS